MRPGATLSSVTDSNHHRFANLDTMPERRQDLSLAASVASASDPPRPYNRKPPGPS